MNIILVTHLNRSKLHQNQKETSLLASQFINVFKRARLFNKDDVINTNATISERKSGSNTDGRFE